MPRSRPARRRSSSRGSSKTWSCARCRGIRGVGSVERIGSVEREIRVGLDPVRLQAVGLTPLDVSRQFAAATSISPAAALKSAAAIRRSARWRARRRSRDLAATRIGLPAGGEVRLDDLGVVTDTIAEPRTFARFNGQPVVGFSILRAKGRKRCRRRQRQSPRAIEGDQGGHPDVELKLIDTSVDSTTVGNYESAMRHAL